MVIILGSTWNVRVREVLKLSDNHYTRRMFDSRISAMEHIMFEVEQGPSNDRYCITL